MKIELSKEELDVVLHWFDSMENEGLHTYEIDNQVYNKLIELQKVVDNDN